MHDISNSKLFQILIAILVAIVVQFISLRTVGIVVRRAVKKSKDETSLDEQKRENTIITILRTTITALVLLVTICAVLGILGVNVAALLTGAGIIGVFVGLSAQNTVKDILAGIFILFEKQYRIGDIITLTGGTTGGSEPTGTVEEITLRITKIRDDSGRLITVRNGESSVVINKTASYSSIVLDINFTYDSDVEIAQKIINQVGVQLMKDPKWKVYFNAPIKFLRIDDFTEQGITIRVTGKVTPASQWEVTGEYRKRLLEAIAKQPKVKLAHNQ